MHVEPTALSDRGGPEELTGHPDPDIEVDDESPRYGRPPYELWRNLMSRRYLATDERNGAA